MTEGCVIFDERAARGGMRVGFARLNAPHRINALGFAMIQRLGERLRSWARDPAIACVVLDGAGERGFCAGGDVVRLRDSMQRDDEDGRARVARFYAREYELDYLIHRYRKPIVCWGGGIVMGGGMGLMSGASHRIVTGDSHLAMPEISIGFYPDVGATWFLNRMPRHLGHFLGLTAAPVNADDALLLGLADYHLDATQQDTVYGRLLDTTWSADPHHNRARLSEILRPLSAVRPPSPERSPVLANHAHIATAMDAPGVPGILTRLDRLDERDPWLDGACATLRAGSPTGACVILEQLRRGRSLSLVQAFESEFRLSLRFAAGHDFPEGVRALLVDKDRTPHWSPPKLSGVDPATVCAHFDAPAEDLPASARLRLHDNGA